jgi:hypothetical protein
MKTKVALTFEQIVQPSGTKAAAPNLVTSKVLVVLLGFFIGVSNSSVSLAGQASGQASGQAAASLSSAAADADARTEDLLIQKLTQVNQSLAPAEPSRVGISLRLADLLSERARRASLAANASPGSQGEQKAVSDRQLALKYYLDCVTKAAPESQGKIYTQIGHLYELLGDETKAVSVYSALLARPGVPSAQAEAHLSLGEIAFKSRQYKTAEKEYAAVLAIPEASSRGLAAYRLAWSQFNSGQSALAIGGLKTILATPALLSRTSTAAAQNRAASIDPQFQEEVSRDLVTFLAHEKVTSQDMQAVFDLSPEGLKLSNLSALATELERVGQTQAAIEAWQFHQKRQTKLLARLEGQIHLSQILMQLSQNSQTASRAAALTEYQNALNLWPQVNESDACKASSAGTADSCRELQTRLKNFIVDWNRVETLKKSLSPDLLATYQAYLMVFPKEIDMRLWSAQLASALNNHEAAFAAYKRAVDDLLAAPSGAAGLPVANAVANKVQLEAATLGMIASAEMLKKPDFLDLAYQTYIDHSPEQKKAFQVRYQQAHLVYERGDYNKAAPLLLEVAVANQDRTDTGARNLKIQAAELALDSLVLTKASDADSKMETWAVDFSGRFPERKDEFNKLARTAIMNQASVLGQAKQYDQAWQTLARFQVGEATPEERVLYYKNRLIVAEKLNLFSESRQAATSLAREPQASAADRQFALTRQAWLSEMVLDFDSALKTTEELPAGAFAQVDQKWLRLALFAELAAKDPKPFYEKYLKDSHDQASRTEIAARLVRESATPLIELNKQKEQLKSSPELYARMALETAVKTSNLDLVKKSLKEPGVAATAAGKAMARTLIINDLTQLQGKFATAKLLSATQRQLSQSLKARIKLLDNLEALSTTSVHSQDWTAQLLTLSTLARESERFYQEILQLPVPAGLSGEETQQYLALLTAQAAPHQQRAQALGKKVEEFWQGGSENSTADSSGAQRTDVLLALKTNLQSETGAMHEHFARELEKIQAIAPEEKKTEIAAILKGDTQTAKAEDGHTTEAATGTSVAALAPTGENLEKARASVRSHPLDRVSVANLLSLEERAGHRSMAGYLQTRLASLDLSQNSPAGRSPTASLQSNESVAPPGTQSDAGKGALKSMSKSATPSAQQSPHQGTNENPEVKQ